MIGDNIRRIRTKQGLSQRQFAVKIGRDVTQVNGWECGRSTPSEQSLAMLAKALDVDVDELKNAPKVDFTTAEAVQVSADTAPDLLRRLARVLGVPDGQVQVTFGLPA